MHPPPGQCHDIPPTKEAIDDRCIVAPHPPIGPVQFRLGDAARRDGVAGGTAMSLGPVTWALYEVRDVEPTERCVLLILADHADPIGMGSRPTHSRIADALGIDISTVRITLEALSGKGLIRHDRCAGDTAWDLVMDADHFFADPEKAVTRTRPASVQPLWGDVQAISSQCRHAIGKTSAHPCVRRSQGEVPT